MLQALRSLGDVKQDGVSTQDVTKDYADLDTRVAVKEQTVAPLRGLLDSRSANLSDVLDVERELSRAVPGERPDAPRERSERPRIRNSIGL